MTLTAPAFAVGDRWEFRGTENGKPYTWSRTIDAMLPGGRMHVTSLRNDVVRKEIYDTSMNYLGEGELARARVLARYPMKLGDTWSFTIPGTSIDAAYSGSARVVAEEHLTTPDGSFNCLEVDAETTYTNRAYYKSFEKVARWYCAEIKWIARENYTSTTQSNVNPAENRTRETRTELSHFTRGKPAH